MIEANNFKCRAICLTNNKRCSRSWSCKGFLCKQHYRLYGKYNAVNNNSKKIILIKMEEI